MKRMILFMLIFSATTFTYGFESDSIVYQKLIGRIDSLEIALQEAKVEISEQVKSLKKMQKDIKQQTYRIENQNKAINGLTNTTDSIGNALILVQQNLGVIADTLRVKIETTTGEISSNVDKSNQKIKKRTIGGSISIVVVLIVAIVLYFVLRKRVKNNDGSLDDIRKIQETLQTTQKNLQEESVKVDNKLIELLESQMKVQPVATPQNSESDHSLVKKVADEVVRIEMNLSKMDSTVKGYKQLASAVKHIKDNFLANGYEITDMLGKPYNEGMRINADFIFDDNLEVGTRTITSIIKPQILYNGELIQKATVKVTQNI